MNGSGRSGASSPRRYDALVIGAGLAGLSAAARLAEGGAKVMLIAKGVGATHLAPATIDVLGYAGGRDPVVEHPGEALGGLDYADASRLLDVARGTVASRLHRARRHLRGATADAA
jgi:glycerol-3-phosphate dehydrogenase subunit B